MYAPTLEQMQSYRSQGNLCPIYREILADLETPVSAYLKVAHGGQSFLLESVTGGQNVGRYSFIGSDPYLVLRMQDGVAQAVQGGYKQTLSYRDPLIVLKLPERLPADSPAESADLRRRRSRLPELRVSALFRTSADSGPQGLRHARQLVDVRRHTAGV